MKIILLLLLLSSLHCKQSKPQPTVEENPFGRFERWLNAPINNDYPNQQDLDSIWGISLPERDWLIEAKARLACVKGKTTIADFDIQSSQDVVKLTSYIADLALRHGCVHLTIDSFARKIKLLENK